MGWRLAALIGFGVPSLGWAQAPPGTDIYLSTLRIDRDKLTVGPPANLTRRPGYDNQPAFTADGKRLLYTSVRPGGPNGTTQADIFQIDLASGSSAPVTETPESEYSATLIPGKNEIAVIRVERDSTQRLWAFPLAGGAPRLLLERIKPVGYQAWLDASTVGVYVLGSPATLQAADLATGDARILLSSVGRAVQRVPGKRLLSVTQLVSDKTWWIIEVDPTTAATRPLARMPDGGEYYLWLPDGSLLSAQGNSLLRMRPGPGAPWAKVATFDGIGGITRLAISPKGDRLAIVAEDSSK